MSLMTVTISPSTHTLMKHIILTLGLGMLLATLSSCDTYVEGHGHARPYPAYGPGHTHTHTDHYYRDSSPPARRSSRPLLNANTNLGVRL